MLDSAVERPLSRFDCAAAFGRSEAVSHRRRTSGLTPSIGSAISAADDGPQIAPGLLAWIERLADWELNRRRGVDFPLHPHDAAIDPPENAISLDAAVMLRALFAQDDRADARGVAALLDAVGSLLSGGEQGHYSAAHRKSTVISLFATTVTLWLSRCSPNVASTR